MELSGMDLVAIAMGAYDCYRDQMGLSQRWVQLAPADRAAWVAVVRCVDLGWSAIVNERISGAIATSRAANELITGVGWFDEV